MKKLSFFLMAMLFSVMSFAETYSLTPNKDQTGLTNTSYITTLTEFEYNGVSWKMNQWNPSSLQVKTNQSSTASEWRFYNTSAFPGKITKVVIKFSALTLSNTTTTGFKFVGGSAAVTATSGGADGVWNATAKTLTWTPKTDDNFTYFALYQNGKVATGTNKLATSDAIVVTYENAGGSAETIVKTLKSIAVEGMTTTYEQGDVFRFDGTCTATYNVTKNDEPQADETKTVTPIVSAPDMNKLGTQVVTVSYTDDKETVSTTYNINIIENTVTPGTYTGNLNNTFFGCSAGNNGTELSGKFDDILVVSGCKVDAQNKTYYDATHVRFYTDTYLKISVPEGYAITSIKLIEATDNFKWDGQISVNKGTYTEDTKSWSGYEQEVQFSFAKQNRIASISVTYELLDVKHIAAPIISGNVEFVESTEVTISAEDGLKVYYTLDGTDPTNASTEYTAPFELTATTTVKAVAYDGENASDIISKTFKQLQVLTCEEAAELCAATESADKYVIRGYVTNIAYAYDAGLNNTSFWMADTKNGGKVFEAYRAQPVAAADKAVKVGDYVEVIGKIVLYNTTPETSAGGTYTIIPAPVVNHTITVSANPAEAGTVTGGGNYEHGAEATLNATPASGYKFVNWTSGETVVSTDNPYSFTVTADVALVANFIKKTISYEMNGGAFPEVKVPTNEELALVFKQEYAEYFAIEGLTDTDMKREVGNFIYVTNSKGGDAIKFITENANWKWLHDYILTVAGNIPEGTNVGFYWRANLDGFFHCKNAVAVGGVASADYTVAGKPEAWGAAYQAAHAVVLPTEPVDAPYTLPTPVKEGYKFVGWYDNAEGTGKPMTVIPAGWDGTLYAIWVEIYTITVEAENGTVEGAGKYEHGAEATLTATAAEGYEFTCWTSGEDTVSTANPYKFTVTADLALVANFKKSVVTHDFYVEDVNVTKTEWSIDLAGSWNEQAFVLKLWQDNTQGFGTYAANAETGYSAVLGVKELTPTAEGYYMEDPMNANAFIFQGTMTDGTDIYEVYLKGALASTGTGEMEAKDDVTFSCDADGAWTIEAYADDVTWGLSLNVAQDPETMEWIAEGYYITNLEAGTMEEAEGTGLLYFDDFSGRQVFKGTLTTTSGEIYPTLYASSLDLMTNELMTGPSWVGEFAGVDYYEVLLTAADYSWELDLHAANCTGANGTYTIDVVDEEEGAYSTFMGSTIVTGELTIEDGMYEAYVTTVDSEGNPAMSISVLAWAAAAEEYDIVINNATVTDNTSGYNIDLTGEWEEHTIKVEVCDELTAETILANFFIDGGIANGGDQAEGKVEATVSEGVVTITGTFECLGSGNVYNVTISGTLPGGTTTALDNLNTTVAPVKAIINGQLIIINNGVQYNAQGQVIK